VMEQDRSRYTAKISLMRTSKRSILDLAYFLWHIQAPIQTDASFFITTAKCDFLDGKHVVFGKVIDGMLTLRKIENVPTGQNNRPKLVVKIVECGEM